MTVLGCILLIVMSINFTNSHLLRFLSYKGGNWDIFYHEVRSEGEFPVGFEVEITYRLITSTETCDTVIRHTGVVKEYKALGPYHTIAERLLIETDGGMRSFLCNDNLRISMNLVNIHFTDNDHRCTDMGRMQCDVLKETILYCMV